MRKMDLPEEPIKREKMFSIRLTVDERDLIRALAKRLKQPTSSMARHFVMQAVQYHSKEKRGEK